MHIRIENSNELNAERVSEQMASPLVTNHCRAKHEFGRTTHGANRVKLNPSCLSVHINTLQSRQMKVLGSDQFPQHSFSP